jgi:hypothetical protein
VVPGEFQSRLLAGVHLRDLQRRNALVVAILLSCEAFLRCTPRSRHLLPLRLSRSVAHVFRPSPHVPWAISPSTRIRFHEIAHLTCSSRHSARSKSLARPPTTSHECAIRAKQIGPRWKKCRVSPTTCTYVLQGYNLWPLPICNDRRLLLLDLMMVVYSI